MFPTEISCLGGIDPYVLASGVQRAHIVTMHFLHEDVGVEG